MNIRIKKIKLILLHTIVGAGIFYFLVHPFTMVLYWFEFNNGTISFSLFREVFHERFMKSFGFEMRGMSGALTVLGAVLGLVSGLLWINFNKKKSLITKQEHLMKRDVHKLIELGENEWVEFKSSMRYDFYSKKPNRELEIVIAKTIVGFMNAHGGKLIIGIDDEGKILGLQKDFSTLKHKNKDGYERELYRIISNHIDREASFKNHVSFYEFNEKKICLIDIEPSSNPVYVIDGKKTTFYIRTGNATYPLSVKETVKHLENKKQT